MNSPAKLHDDWRHVATVEVADLADMPLRELNGRLHALAGDAPEPRRWRIDNPNGAHAVACGLDHSERFTPLLLSR